MVQQQNVAAQLWTVGSFLGDAHGLVAWIGARVPGRRVDVIADDGDLLEDVRALRGVRAVRSPRIAQAGFASTQLRYRQDPETKSWSTRESSTPANSRIR